MDIDTKYRRLLEILAAVIPPTTAATELAALTGHAGLCIRVLNEIRNPATTDFEGHHKRLLGALAELFEPIPAAYFLTERSEVPFCVRLELLAAVRKHRAAELDQDVAFFDDYRWQVLIEDRYNRVA
jgi:hypothetical protein